VGLPHCQHSAAPLLLRCTVNVAPSLYKIGYNNVCVLRQQNKEYHLECGGELRYKHLVYGVRHFSYGISKGVNANLIRTILTLIFDNCVVCF
jgi:hypothetical protein